MPLPEQPDPGHFDTEHVGPDHIPLGLQEQVPFTQTPPSGWQGTGQAACPHLGPENEGPHTHDVPFTHWPPFRQLGLQGAPREKGEADVEEVTWPRLFTIRTLR